MNIEIGKKIRLLRLCKGLTQEQLAEKLCVTAQSVSKWENDITAPDIALLPQISVVLGVTIDELFSMTDESRLVRIESILESCSKDTIIPEKDFESFRAFLTEHKDDAELKGRVYTALAWLYDQQADAYRGIAAKYAETAIELEPYKKSNHSAYGIAMNGMNRDWYMAEHNELIRFYLDFVERYPDNVPALQQLLDNLIADSRADEAEYVLSKLKHCDDSCRTLNYEAQICHLRGNDEGMNRALEQLTEQYSEDWLAWSYKGDIYARLAQYDKASECWLHSFELQPSPRLIDDLLDLAQAAVIRKRFRKAAEYYEKALDVLKEDHSVTEGEMAEHLKYLADKYSKM